LNTKNNSNGDQMNTIWNRLKFYLRPYKLHFIIVIIATLAVTFFNLVGPWISRELIKVVTTTAENGVDRSFVLSLALILLGTYLLRGGAEFVKSYVAHLMAWNFLSDLRVSVYEHLQKLSLRYYEDRPTGEIMSRVVSDTEKLEPLIAHNIPDLAVNATVLLGVASILFYLSPQLALMTLVPIPLLILVVWLFSGKMRINFRISQERLADFNALLQDNITGMKEIQIFTREPYEQKRVENRSKSYTRSILRALRLSAVYHPAVEFAASLGTIIVVLFGGWEALKGTLAIEDLVAFMLYLGMFYAPVTVLARMNEQVQQALAGAERVVDILEVEPDVKEASKPVSLNRAQGEIRFENVSFSYLEDIPVLHEISLTVKPGQTLALVGPTGVGKSTLVSLIPRFYDPNYGRVLIDGTDVRQIKLKDLRRNVSMVLQDVFLFNGTVKENIMYGNDQASFEDVVRAAKIANAHEFIEKMPEGYDTHIGERGVKLSGGQKQRLSIARAVLKNAPILILDEATSSVDVETEALIQEALYNLLQGRTALVIAHRLSTIQKADIIAVLDKGQIVEKGSHDELTSRDTLYRKMVYQQFGWSDSEKPSQ
jgi:ATP-binding cassette subfamily B protein